MSVPVLGSLVHVHWDVGTQYGWAGVVTPIEYTDQIGELVDAGYGWIVSTLGSEEGDMDIGNRPPEYDLTLNTGEDYHRTFRWHSGPFPVGSRLFLVIAADEYDFTIDGDTATLDIQSEITDLVPARTPYRLTYSATAETPTRETTVCQGRVKRGGPKTWI